jgi:hypothetical protein
VRCFESHVVSADDFLNLLSADGTLCKGLELGLVEDSPCGACLAHDPMRAIQKDCVDFPSEADVAVVERVFLLLQQAAQLLNLLLQH